MLPAFIAPFIAFGAGVAACQQQAVLLPWWPALCVLPLVLIRRRWRWRWPAMAVAGFVLGFAWAGWRAELRLADGLSASLEGSDVRVSGYIADLPRADGRSLRFVFHADERPSGVPSRMLVSWYADREGRLPAVRGGERWHLVLRVRRPHGNLNPHGFDYEAWLFERGIRASAYVRDTRAEAGVNRRLAQVDGSGAARVQAMRETIRERFHRALPRAEWAGVLIALAIGDQASIPQRQWQLFNQTGVTHLMSISGLHVTLIAALAAWGVNLLWRRSVRLCIAVPAQKAAVAAGALVAAAYVVLAGFGVPAQRTLYMLLVVALAMWLRRGAGVAYTLGLAMLVVLLLDPWAVLSAGFWLSFGAVAALMLVSQGVAREGIPGRMVWGFLRTQWAVTLLSLPLLLGLFQKFSLVSPFANALAIPLVSAVVTPLALSFALLPLPALAELAHWLLEVLMQVLQWMAALPHASWQQAAPPWWLVAICVLAALWALLPRGVPGRWTALLAMIPLLAWTPPRPPPGEFRATVLDVGQGLAVHVQTATQDLLFDAGPQYASDSDSGERVIVPYLRAAGVTRLAGMVVSHADDDHAGGADSVLQQVPTAWLAASLPDVHPLRAIAVRQVRCRDGQTWQADGVRFGFLHPGDEAPASDNDGSCVLHVSSPWGSLLLPGDIESDAEARLKARPLHADVLVAPHHGSRTSSTPDFVTAVAARHVVFTAGYRNRFRHPHPQVVARYVESGARLWRSDRDGAVRFVFGTDGIHASAERQSRARYWHGR